MAAGRASPPDLVPAAEPVSPVRTNKESATTIRNTTKSFLLCRLCIVYFGTWEQSEDVILVLFLIIIIVILQTWICCNAGLGWTPLPHQTSGKTSWSFKILGQRTATLCQLATVLLFFGLQFSLLALFCPLWLCEQYVLSVRRPPDFSSLLSNPLSLLDTDCNILCSCRLSALLLSLKFSIFVDNTTCLFRLYSTV